MELLWLADSLRTTFSPWRLAKLLTVCWLSRFAASYWTKTFVYRRRRSDKITPCWSRRDGLIGYMRSYVSKSVTTVFARRQSLWLFDFKHKSIFIPAPAWLQRLIKTSLVVETVRPSYPGLCGESLTHTHRHMHRQGMEHIRVAQRRAWTCGRQGCPCGRSFGDKGHRAALR